MTYVFDKNVPIHEISSRHENKKRKTWIISTILNSIKQKKPFYKNS